MFTQKVYILRVIHTVTLSKQSQRDLKRVPKHIVIKLMAWIESVENDGLEEVRKIPGFHDEPLKGDRKGQRSIRLSKAYRAIYTISSAGRVEFVEVQEVHKHDY